LIDHPTVTAAWAAVAVCLLFRQLDDGIGCATLTVVLEPIKGNLSILADLGEVAVGIAHVAAPFQA